MTQTKEQHETASNEQRMAMVGISKNTRNMLIAVGKIEDAVTMVTDELIETFGEEPARDLIQDTAQYYTDLKNRVFYLISEVMQKEYNNLKSTEL